jgi:hypothetical protein
MVRIIAFLFPAGAQTEEAEGEEARHLVEALGGAHAMAAVAVGHVRQSTYLLAARSAAIVLNAQNEARASKRLT